MIQPSRFQVRCFALSFNNKPVFGCDTRLSYMSTNPHLLLFPDSGCVTSKCHSQRAAEPSELPHAAESQQALWPALQLVRPRQPLSARRRAQLRLNWATSAAGAQTGGAVVSGSPPLTHAPDTNQRPSAVRPAGQAQRTLIRCTGSREYRHVPRWCEVPISLTRTDKAEWWCFIRV